MSNLKLPIFSICAIWLLISCEQDKAVKTVDIQELTDYYQSPESDTALLEITNIAGPEVVPSPACLAVAPTGEIFVGVDMMGSLGKEPGKGSIVRLVDGDHDGTYEQHTEFVKVDNPRGILVVGDQVFVLHTVFDESTGEADRMDLVVFEDKNWDGQADGPGNFLIKNICSQQPLKGRGTDHATNGIRMGIDGWIYIAVGDFGFYNAEDRTGKKMTMLGGGIVRVRPDGTEMEVYAHGTRNIYDVAIDPFMNIYTRGNTNDGGGWNVRFIHYMQSGEYGYPMRFKYFTDEILPALIDLGGGSGTGSYFMDDDRWPAAYNHVPMMADWGRSQLYTHRVALDGPGFTQSEKEFIKLSQITDVDVDGSGRMFLSAWDGAGYRGSPEKGYVVKVVPDGWEYEPFPNLSEVSVQELGVLLKAGNSVARSSAQQELVRRSGEDPAQVALEVAKDKSLALASRVAGVYTYAQITCGDGVEQLLDLSKEDKMREFALRAMTDRMTCLESVPIDPFIYGVRDANPRVQAAAIVGLGRLGNPKAAKVLLDVRVPVTTEAPEMGTEGPHAAPNPDIILPHLAVQSLIRLNAVDQVLEAIDSNPKLALWTLRYMHNPKAVDGLIAKYEDSGDGQLKKEILTTLSRLYHKEAPYDGSWWWGTRPDTHGPYYKGIIWDESEKIRSFLVEEMDKTPENENIFAYLNDRHRMEIEELGTMTVEEKEEESKVDLNEIKSKKGQVGKSSIEDVILAVSEIKGDAAKGKQLFTSQGCIACHSISKGETMKGPFMGQIGSIMNRDQITESILKPNASISQGFASFHIKTRGGKSYLGFVTAESADKITIRDITGQATELDKSDIESREEMENSMMPSGLANALSFEELASLVTYLQSQK
ncbi:MAG: c-type cytochrome [Cyclobacteriaceae bacterium]|nr:c-type cytochrome [Cyclobacteriaceae bacterium SS2]